MDQNESNTGLKTGYGSHSKWKKEFKKLDPKIYRSYPDGKVWAIGLTIIVIIGLGLALGLGAKSSFYFSTQWYNIIWYILGAAMCIIGLAWLSRIGFMSSLRYGWLKFTRLIKWDVLRRKIKYKVIYEAIDDVTTYDEYKDYLKEKNKHTKKNFIITTIVYGSLFVIWTIVMIACNAAKIGWVQ